MQVVPTMHLAVAFRSASPSRVIRTRRPLFWSVPAPEVTAHPLPPVDIHLVHVIVVIEFVEDAFALGGSGPLGQPSTHIPRAGAPACRAGSPCGKPASLGQERRFSCKNGRSPEVLRWRYVGAAVTLR
jgi:hypothetical protein